MKRWKLCDLGSAGNLGGAARPSLSVGYDLRFFIQRVEIRRCADPRPGDRGPLPPPYDGLCRPDRRQSDSASFWTPPVFFPLTLVSWPHCS